MATPDPEHFFEQADRLVIPQAAGAPRQVDLRRAMSAAYYGVFHAVLTALADEFVGVTKRGTPQYELVYRSVDHRALRDLCNEMVKPTPSRRYSPFIPASGIGRKIQVFAASTVDLQERRHTADYNPTPLFRTADAHIVVATARSAVSRFSRATPERRKAFLTLLLCPPR